MIANCCSIKADRVVRFDDGSAFDQVGFERALPHVAGINYEDGAAVLTARRTQRIDVSRNCDQPAAVRVRQQLAVNIVGPEEGNREFVAWRIALRGA